MNQVTNEHYSDFTIKWATLKWEQEQAFALRREVFCHEQQVFEHDDRDDVDTHAQTLIAIANHGGWHEKIVGTVRIHNQDEHVWWGSRLAVNKDFRGQRGLGGALIRLAVCSARALGCTQFLAQVQKQNEALFQKLNWTSQFELNVHNHLHVMMQADLNQFLPCYQPKSGYVVKSDPPKYSGELGASFLQPILNSSHTSGDTQRVT